MFFICFLPLTKTVRGMMYYRKALKLQAFLDMAEDEGLSYSDILTLPLHRYSTQVNIICMFPSCTRYPPRFWCNWEEKRYIISSTWSLGRHEVYTCCVLSNIWITEDYWWPSGSRHTKFDDKVLFPSETSIQGTFVLEN